MGDLLNFLSVQWNRLSADLMFSVKGEEPCPRLDPALWSGRLVVVAQVTGSSDTGVMPLASDRLVGEGK